MKLKQAFLSLLIIGLANTSCKQDNNVNIDCLKEEVLVSIEHEHNPDNKNILDFTIIYTGNKTITGVSWDFGDGTSESGDSLAVTHMYTDTGKFVTKAAVMIEGDGVACTLNPQKQIRVK